MTARVAPEADLADSGSHFENSSSPERRPRRHTAAWCSAAVAVVVGLLIVVLATRPPATGVSIRSPLLGKPAPEASGVTIDGTSATLSDLRGRWVLLNVFATWCVPCRAEHPDLVAFSDEHRSTGDVSVFGLVYADTPAAVRQFRVDHGGDWPMLEDPEGRIALNFGVSGVPESFVISPDGVVVAKYIGGVRLAQLDRNIAELKARPR